MDTIVVTGSSGLLASELIDSLKGKYHIIALTGSLDKAKERWGELEGVACSSLDNLKDILGGVKPRTFVHCAFARSSDGRALASSLAYTKEIVEAAREFASCSFVNISSQSVYGQSTEPPWSEEVPAAPNYPYALAKFATEQVVSAAFSGTGITYTNLRLSSVCENARFLNVFAKNAVNGVPIKVLGGSQLCSLMDVRDAAAGIASVVDHVGLSPFEEVYNLGTGESRSILQLALDVQRLCKENFGLDVEIDVEPSNERLAVGMDVAKFKRTFSWSPEYGYDDMILSLLELNGLGGGSHADVVQNRLRVRRAPSD